MYDMNQWDDKFQKLAEVYRALGVTVEYRWAEPASATEVTALEEKLGHQLPPSLKEFLTAFSKDLKLNFRFMEVEGSREMFR